MVILHIEHQVPDYAAWRAAFDSDPADRARSGVRRYRVMRPVDDAHTVLIELEFATRPEAEAMRAKLREVWGAMEGKIMSNPHARIVEAEEVTIG